MFEWLLLSSIFEAFGINGQSSKEERVSCITSTEAISVGEVNVKLLLPKLLMIKLQLNQSNWPFNMSLNHA